MSPLKWFKSKKGLSWIATLQQKIANFVKVFDYDTIITTKFTFAASEKKEKKSSKKVVYDMTESVYTIGGYFTILIITLGILFIW